jgi:hypothetical protein
MSFWTVPTVAANKAVAAPTMVTTRVAVALVSNIGDSRQTMNTPAVTIVAAWISAETGVGPSIASGSQVCRPNWADLPQAPMNRRMQMRVIVSKRAPRKPIVEPAMPGRGFEDCRDRDRAEHQEGGEDAEREAEIADPVDDERLDRRGVGRRLVVPEADQQVGSEADPSQPKNIWTRLSAVTSISIAKLNSDR